MSALPLESILLDNHALTGLVANAPAMQVWAAYAIKHGSTIYVSAVTLAEATSGSPRDAELRRRVNGLKVCDATVSIGYSAGALRARAAERRRKPRDLTVDAVLAATALTLAGRTCIVTGDPHDFELLLGGSDVRVEAI